ncbi:MAG TPA: SMC-Scp complex subunit ScpB, partial [Alphaproteobacteria bacterium]|nr:SMC-Scp complex subunit ScpB [Alphaproteobacteria bacterium]
GAHRDTPGRPTMWVTTEAFMSHFGLESLEDLPNIDELKAAGLLDARPAVSAYSEEGDVASTSTDDEDDDDDASAQENAPEMDEPPPDRLASAGGGRAV